MYHYVIMYYHIIILDCHKMLKLLCFPFPQPGHLPLQYARNPHVRWLLHRFHGRDRRLETMSAPCWLDDLPYTEYTLLANCTSIQEWFEWCFSMFECVFSRLCLKCSNLKGSVICVHARTWLAQQVDIARQTLKLRPLRMRSRARIWKEQV